MRWATESITCIRGGGGKPPFLRMRYKIKTKKGNESVLEAQTQIEITEAARRFCKSKGEGWPGCVVVWERVEETEPKKGGKKL